MDPLSAFGLVSGVVQVAQAIFATIEGLNTLVGKYKDADFTIGALIRELKCIQTALRSLREWTQDYASGTLPGEYMQDLSVAMDGCHAVMEVLQKDVWDLVQGTSQANGVVSFRSRLRVVWNDEVMRAHQERLHSQVLALQLLLQVCQCHSSAEQVRLLRQATTRQILRKVADDTATLRSSRASRVTSPMPSIAQSSSLPLNDKVSDFHEAAPQSPAYPHATWMSLSQSTDSSSVRGPYADEGYSSGQKETMNLTIPSAEATAQQADYLSLPNSPSGLLSSALSGHGRSKSVNQIPSLPHPKSVWRAQSDSKASSKTVQRMGSKGKFSSIIERINTLSRPSLAALSAKGSISSTSSSTSARGRRSRDPDIQGSIDLASPDGASAPPIVRAAQAGSRDEVERLIGRCDLEARHRQSGRTALLVAAHCGREEVLNLLIQNNARLTAMDGSSSTALHLAASRGHCGILEILMGETDLIEGRDSQGRTALWVAADRGQLAALQMLIKYHAKINARAENHMTALHAAAKRGDDEVVQLLLAHGADLESKDGAMMTALHYACREGHLGVVDLLLDHRADIEAPGRDRKTPLIFAAEAGRVSVVERLLKRKVALRRADDTGMNALHWAACNGHEEIVAILSEKKGSLMSVNSMGQTALHLAVIHSQFAVVESLMRKGVPPGRRCKTGLTALHYACLVDNPKIATLLLLHDSDIETQSQQQQRPLHIAAAQGSVGLLDLLCDKGAALDARDGIGDRPLCVACRYGRVAAAQKLLDRGSPLYLKVAGSHREDSPLCLAAMGGHLNVASLLLERGASVLRKDEAGKQPFHYAAIHGHPDVLQLLLSCSNVSDLDIPDKLLMPEIIGFSSQTGISDERKRQVQDILQQALENPGSISTGVSNSYIRAGTQQSSTAGCFPPPVQSFRDISASTRQELPATLEQGLPSSRSVTPTGMRAIGLEPSMQTGLRQGMQEGGQSSAATPPWGSDRLVALLEDEARRASFNPQRESQTRSSRSRGREPSPEVGATYVPRPVPIRWTPATPAVQPLPDRSRASVSIAPTPVSSVILDTFDAAARVPRTLPFMQEPPLSSSVPARSRSHSSEPQPGVEAGHDDWQEPVSDDDDSDSTSSLYTAPEGETVPGDSVSVLDPPKGPVYEIFA